MWNPSSMKTTKPLRRDFSVEEASYILKFGLPLGGAVYG
jgi:hypothetical protein